MAARLLLGVAAVLLEVPGDQRLDHVAVVGVEVAAGHEMIGHRPALVAGPGLEGGDELALVDQAVLECEQAEEEVARWVDRRWCHRRLLVEWSWRHVAALGNHADTCVPA